MAKALTLAEFAATRSIKRPCFVCGSPDRKEIEAAWAAGIKGQLISAWLKAKGEDVKEGRIRRHFEAEHDVTV